MGGVLLALFVLVSCGGRTLADSSNGVNGDTADQGGSSSAADECALGGAQDDGGCGGMAGEKPLEDYARLRTACSRNTKVNRRGMPVSIDYCIR